MTSSATTSDYPFFSFPLWADPSIPDIVFSDEDLLIGDFLNPMPSAFEPHRFPEFDSVGNTPNHDSSLGLNVFIDRSSTTPVPFDPTVWVHGSSGLPGFFPPPGPDLIPDVTKNFDSEIPVADTHSAAFLYEPEEELEAEGQETFNSAWAADDLVPFSTVLAPICNTLLAAPVVASPVSSPPSSVTDCSDSDRSTSPPPEAIQTRKRKFQDIDSDDEDFNVTSMKRQKEQSSSQWERQRDNGEWLPYSVRIVNGKKLYRCDLCPEKNPQICKRPGDMKRHQCSLQHAPKSHRCSGCSNNYTREDALKRHRPKCSKNPLKRQRLKCSKNPLKRHRLKRPKI
ncbi:hypothetical protein BYT27DRAFT_7180986 [Phlegmacium glaucopus]|nr:hypothetical protein BYT27DRAFT_7180986 [Phlegmacium glaucopus]